MDRAFSHDVTSVILLSQNNKKAVTDPGEDPRGPGAPLVLDQTEIQRAEKNFLETPPPPLSKGLDDRASSLS